MFFFQTTWWGRILHCAQNIIPNITRAGRTLQQGRGWSVCQPEVCLCKGESKYKHKWVCLLVCVSLYRYICLFQCLCVNLTKQNRLIQSILGGLDKFGSCLIIWSTPKLRRLSLALEKSRGGGDNRIAVNSLFNKEMYKGESKADKFQTEL